MFIGYFILEKSAHEDWIIFKVPTTCRRLRHRGPWAWRVGHGPVGSPSPRFLLTSAYSHLTLTPLSTVHDPALFLSNDYKTVKYHDKQVSRVKSLIFLYHYDFPIRFRVRFHVNYDWSWAVQLSIVHFPLSIAPGDRLDSRHVFLSPFLGLPFSIRLHRSLPPPRNRFDNTRRFTNTRSYEDP